jgi:3-hydroxyacyl-CoA dehydrogenase
MTHANQDNARKVGIIGAGSIGVRLAAAFAAAGFPVSLSDPDEHRRAAVPGEIRSLLAELTSAGLADGGEVPAVVAELRDCVAGAALVFECGPECLDVKRDLAREILAEAPADTIVLSASSALTASEIAGALPEEHRSRFLIAHPINPPHVIKVLELAAAPFTSERTLRLAGDLVGQAGYHGVAVRGEPTGFVYNRLQGAVLREAYCLVRDGVISVSDLDLLVREALGFRWSVIGPFETVDLNTRGGIAAHAEKLGPAYARMGAERGQNDPWTDELVEKVSMERRTVLPLERWEERVSWRDRELLALATYRQGRKET